MTNKIYSIGSDLKNYLRECYEESGLSIATIARKTGLSENTVRRAFDPDDLSLSLRTTAKLCVVFNVKMTLKLSSSTEKSVVVDWYA